jgi:hypothetical protein
MTVTTARRAARLFLILAFIVSAATARNAAAAASPNDVTNSTVDDGTAECSTRAATRSTGRLDRDACRRSGREPPTSGLYSRHYFGAAAE